jgi:hypothetical protein
MQTLAHAMAEGDPISVTSDAFVDILNSLLIVIHKLNSKTLVTIPLFYRGKHSKKFNDKA